MVSTNSAWQCEESNPEVTANLGRTSSKRKYIHQKTFRSQFTIGKMDPLPVGASREQNVVAARPPVPPSQDQDNMDDFKFDDRADHLNSPNPSEPDV
ncbi:hypothetical protein PSTG_12231 [Puccinia striiformis f. sp. tritici PST-78]|uniref:Uncharacterized protein n=1 Tax=Puccinia striiformis f. sp. tritici PST-78 TaxID=1165861 RepID=A0A0L0V585_9BASI|nr:hypothetical protein PSTG_12231 [Puccinia striiformis f. sp. tritici PST-78]